MSSEIRNPVLPGFHPDPAILRVGKDYYLATSTFEWWPGVRIHHSRDLVHWQHCTYPLTRPSQLDMRGNPDSCGVWAPCLSHAHGLFHLIYTDVKSLAGAYKDAHNYLVTAPHIHGPWSEPVYLNSSGFDPSMFHDEDGRSWLLNMEWSHRAGQSHFSGILLQEYDRVAQRLTGPIHKIFTGSELGLVEGPHLYRKDGYYYLMVAEGGTGYEHAVTVARSTSLTGPYVLAPLHPLLTSRGKAHHLLQRAGHGSLVETEGGEWYLAHLCGRPIEWQQGQDAGGLGYQGDLHEGDLHCVLGRETALQKIVWTSDGWPALAQGGNAPAWTVPAPELAPAPFDAEPLRDHFDGSALSPHFNSLRVPITEDWASLRARPGFLRLAGRESPMSTSRQSLIARRQQHFHCRAETALEFDPHSFQQMAGLIAYYNTQNHAWLRLSWDEALQQPALVVAGNDNGIYQEWSPPLGVGQARRVWLRVRFALAHFQFDYALREGEWQAIGPQLPARLLSDEYATRFDGGYARSFGFTGNYLGLMCSDLTGRRLHADFDYFDYEGH